MFKKSQDRDIAFQARPTLVFGQLFAVQPLKDLESIFDLVWNDILMPVQILIHSDLVNKGLVRQVFDQLGKFVSADSPAGNWYEAKMMVPLKEPLTRKVVFNSSKRSYIMSAFYPKLPFRACKKCFVLYHNEAKCNEILSRIVVTALPAPSSRATHVAVTNVKPQSVAGESSKPKNTVSEDNISEHSKPSAFSISLQPSGCIGNRNSAFSPIVVPSVLPPVLPHMTALTIRESMNPHTPPHTQSAVSSFVSHFNNFTLRDFGNVQDRKGKRPRTTFESVYLEAISFSSSSVMMPTPRWPPLTSAPPFSPPDIAHLILEVMLVGQLLVLLSPN